MRRLWGFFLLFFVLSCSGKYVEDGFVKNEGITNALLKELKGDYEGALNDLRKADGYWGNLLSADIYLYRYRDYRKALDLVNKVKVRKTSPASQEVLYRKALLLELLGNYAEAGKLYEELAIRFPNGKYFESASQAVEEMFRRNFPDTVVVYDGGYVTSMMVDYAIEQIPPFNRAQFDNPEGRKQIAERLAIEVAALRLAESMRLDTSKDVREKVDLDKINILRQAYYQYGVREKAKATDQELLAYYNANKSQYRVPARVDIRRIVLKDSAKAEEVLKYVKEGKNIDSLVKEFSVEKADVETGGRLSIYDTYESLRDIFNAAYEKDTGSVFIYKRDTLWMVIKVESKEKDRIRSFDEVKTMVRGAVEGQKEREIFESEKKRLREFYGVKIFLKEDTTEVKKGEEEKEEEGKVLTEEEKNFLKALPETLAVIQKINKAITKADFEDRLNKMPARYRSYYLSPKGAYQLVNDIMVQEILEVSEAEFRRYYLHYPFFKRLRDSYRDAMLLRLYDVLVKGKVSVSDDEIKEYYEKNKDKEFKEMARIRVQRVVVPTRDSARKVLAKVSSIKNENKLRDFIRKTSVYTGEGMAGGFAFLTPDKEPDLFKEAWKKPLKVWSIGKLNDGNWAVYRVLEKIKERVKPFDEVKSYIREKLRYEKEKALYEQVLEQIKKDYKIVVFEEKFKEEGNGGR
ncbi:MAG: peptidyl-prolyl cis-trans isomerase [Candidatus Caldipriscus sp.]|nr:peptidyl-prolyl cis-trans isomerase [Candidatus Caldipriscus sp.]